MFTKKSRFGYGSRTRKIRTALTVAGGIIALAALVTAILFIVKIKNRAGGGRQELLRLWEAASYEQVFSVSKTALEAKPVDYFLLTINGYSAYQLGISQINELDALKSIDECIRSLRKAMLLKKAVNDGALYYVLGKAYFYKGEAFADFAVEYLEKAGSLSYSAADLSEYLGQAYAAVGDYRSSVAAFSAALEPPLPETEDAAAGNAPAKTPSDILLLSIARSYAALGEADSARAYLLRCIEISPDAKTVLTARMLLAGILGKAGDTEGAEAQYRAVLDSAGENAEAHYQLGEIYAQREQMVRARAEWRAAYKADPSHAEARARLNL